MAYRDVLRDFNLYVDGLGYAGRLLEFVPPKVTIVEEDYRAAGMDAPIPIDLGIEKLVAECTLGAHDADIMSRVGQVLLDTIFVVRGALVSDGGGPPTPVTHTMIARGVRAVDPGTWKPGELTQLKFTIHPNYYRIDQALRPVLEIDIANGIRRLNGIDQLGAIRSIVGR